MDVLPRDKSCLTLINDTSHHLTHSTNQDFRDGLINYGTTRDGSKIFDSCTCIAFRDKRDQCRVGNLVRQIMCKEFHNSYNNIMSDNAPRGLVKLSTKPINAKGF